MSYNKSISQLETWAWKSDIPSKSNSSYEEYNFYLLHNKPLKNFSAEDVNFMIVQESGLKYLIPIAIDILAQNIFIEAENYPCDLLKNTLSIDKETWLSNKKAYTELLKIIKSKEQDIRAYKAIGIIRKKLIIALDYFLQLEKSITF